MPKSKYPQQLDTSIEIQPVRDNILEVGSDVINSLRSAIFNIEKTLGINPQGAVGNTLSERLNKSLDSNGNIKSEALSNANILTGPIIDADVSKVAAIQESKLKLDFPTQLLQNEISILNSTLDDIISQISTLSTELSLHIYPGSLNRHPAKSISISSYIANGDDVAIKNLASGTVQSAFEDIIDAHINYTGLNISSENNSHLASQVYFDNTNVSSVIKNINVQDAIEDLASNLDASVIEHQDLMHSNGILRVGNINTPLNASIGKVLVESASASFSKSLNNEYNEVLITLNDTVDISNFYLEKSDIVTISDTSNSGASYIGSFEIIRFSKTSNILNTVTVIGNFSENSTANTVIKITKNTKVKTNEAALLATAREEATLTSARTVQLANPNAVSVITKGINPYNISVSNRYINISIDGGTTIILDLYNNSVTTQTLESIISRINEQCAEGAYDFLAYKVFYEDLQPEIAIVYNLPDTDTVSHYITISRGSDDAIDSCGFSHVEDLPVYSKFGTQYYIGGKPFTGLKSKLDSNSLIFLSLSNIVTNTDQQVDFLKRGIKNQDLLIITNATNSNDNGTYVIQSVSSNQLTISAAQLPSGFLGSSDDLTNFKVFSNTYNLDNYTFDKVSSTFGGSLFDIFLNEDRDLVADKRVEYTVLLFGIKSLITLLDFDGELTEENFTLNIKNNIDFITLSLDGGKEVDVYGDNNYFWITSGIKDLRFKFYIPSVADVVSKITSMLSTEINMTLYGFDGLNTDSNLKIARFPYNNYTGNGSIVGYEYSSRAIKKTDFGLISENDLSTSAKENLLNKPRAELRSNGVVNGLEITSPVLTSGYFTFNIESGTCYVRGKRIKIPKTTNFITHIDSAVIDKIFIYVNEDGQIIVESSTPSCLSPLEYLEACPLATLEWDGTSIYNIDLRLFVDNLDLKLLNSITVSPQIGMGHFSELGEAVKYAKRFSSLFPKAGVPAIHLKSGTHNVEVVFEPNLSYADWASQSSITTTTELVDALAKAGLVIDFPVSIYGEGDSTEVVLRNKYIYTDVTYTYKGTFILCGKGFASHTVPIEKIDKGNYTFSNFKMNNSKITCFDLNIKDGSDNLPFLISIDNITFDHQNFESPNPIDASFKFSSILSVEFDDTTTSKGNLSISNCSFITDPADTSGSAIIFSSANETKNISITNNRFVAESSTTSLINIDIVTFNSADSGSNITISGNTATGTVATADGSRPSIYSGLGSWSDRISKDLRVGGIIHANSNLYAKGLVRTEDDFSYLTTKSFSQTYRFSNCVSVTDGLTSSTATHAQSSLSVGAYSYTLTASRTPVGQSTSLILDRLPAGCKLTNFMVGLKLSPNTLITATLSSIFKTSPSLPPINIKVNHYTNTISTGAVVSGALNIVNFTGVDEIISDDSFYFIELSHNDLSYIDFFYIKAYFEFNNISEALGLL
jgi:hypothetical protein